MKYSNTEIFQKSRGAGKTDAIPAAGWRGQVTWKHKEPTSEKSH